jgi:hypothetical protein
MVGAVAVLSLTMGCAGALQESGFLPTASVRSTPTDRAPEFPSVGVRPAAPAPDLTTEERERSLAELDRLRARNRALGSAPENRPLPR